MVDFTIGFLSLAALQTRHMQRRSLARETNFVRICFGLRPWAALFRSRKCRSPVDVISGMPMTFWTPVPPKQEFT